MAKIYMYFFLRQTYMYFPLLNIHFKKFVSNSIKRICSYSIQQFEHRGRPPDEHVLE